MNATIKKLVALASVVTVTACTPPPAGLPTPPPHPNAELPSQILDLRNWTLTTSLPSPETGALEIKQPKLNEYTHEYFKVSESKSAVIFTTPSSGAVQKGAECPRTELREVQPNGGSAEWSTRQGTHTLTVTASIDKLPSSEMEVVGQVHAIGPYILLIQLNKKKLYVKAGDRNIATLDNKYRLGTLFEFKFVAAEGRIKVFYNGRLEATYESDCSRCYFKTGSYLQAPPRPGDPSIGQVSIYSIKVTHTD